MKCATPDAFLATCDGRVPRETWLDPAQRLPACAAAVAGSKQHSADVKIVFCLLNADTQRLCAKVVEWRDTIQRILCQAAGVCPAAAFFYSPTTYDIANQEFAHDTVTKYYEGLGATCPAEAQATTAEQVASNNKLLGRCAAVALERIKRNRLLRSIRDSVLSLVI